MVAEVLDYAKSCNLIRLPEPGRDGDDKSKYCAYHRNRGHDTEDCNILNRDEPPPAPNTEQTIHISHPPFVADLSFYAAEDFLRRSMAIIAALSPSVATLPPSSFHRHQVIVERREGVS
nr:uncharacterized protein LOC109171571 [Ipomoea batatas]